MRPTRENEICAAAYPGTTGAWLFEGFDTLQWLTIAEEHRKANHLHDAEDAYLISSTLQGLDKNEKA